MSKIKEILEQTSEELENRIEEIERKVFELKNELRVSRKIEKPHQLRELKKEKAKILTVLTQRKGKA